jgi:lipopolysaccharide export system permease protein
MMGVLAAYLRRRVLTRTLALAAVLAALIQVLELLDVTTDVLDRGLGFQGLLHYAALRAPGEIVLALPLAALLGAMSAFHEMARNDELIPMRTAGVSLKQIVLYLLPVPLLVGCVQFSLSETLVPVAETSLKSWWDSTAPPDEAPERRWLRTGAGPVSYAAASYNGRRLTGLRIYLRGDDKLLTERVSADTAQWARGTWRLEGIQDLKISNGQVTRLAQPDRIWKTNLKPSDVKRARVAQPHLSSIMLADILAGERVGNQPLSFYQTALYRSFMAPLAAFIMLLLALPAACGLPRRGAASGLLLTLGLGLAFLVSDGIMVSLGTSGRIPSALAAFSAPLVFATIGLLQLRACEHR